MSKIFNASGKRKRAVARATIKDGKGQVRINKTLLNYYNPELARDKIMEPLILAGDLAKKIKIDIDVKGGGWQSQAEAVRLAVAKAIVGFTNNKSLRQSYLDYDRHLLVADVRRNEPHKPNDSKPRAKRQKSYR